MVLRLAHVELGVDDLEKARTFYCDLLGLRLHLEQADALFLRAAGEFDTWSLKLVRTGHAGLMHAAFRVSGDSDLAELAASHRLLGPRAIIVPEEHEPGQGRALRAVAPNGIPVEFVHELAEIRVAPDEGVYLPGRGPGVSAPAGAVRLDHINLRGPDVQAAMKYWVETLRFSISEFRVDAAGEIDMAWMRRTLGSHDVAFGRAPTPGFHHVAYAVDDQSTLSRLADRLADAGLQDGIEFGPGRHGTTNAYFLYVHDPAGNRVELYCGDYQRDLDRPPVKWEAQEYQRHGLLWWGQPPPASFFEAGPIAGDAWLSEGRQVQPATVANGAGAPAPVSMWLETLDLPWRQHHVDAGGIRTRVLEAGDGSPLVLLHGTGGHAEAYVRNLRELSTRHRVVAYDMLGHGFTDKPEGAYTVDRFSDHLAAVMDALGIESAHLSGESLGAWVAAWFAAYEPDRVRRVLLNTPGNITNKPEVMAMIRDSTRKAVREASPETVRARLSWLFAPKNRSLIPEELVWTRYAIYAQGGYERAVEGVLALQDPAIRERYAWDESWCGRIRAPTLVLWTTDDPTGTEDEGRLLASWIPSSRLEVIEDAGHWPQWERPDEFNRLALSFFGADEADGP